MLWAVTEDLLRVHMMAFEINPAEKALVAFGAMPVMGAALEQTGIQFGYTSCPPCYGDLPDRIS